MGGNTSDPADCFRVGGANDGDDGTKADTALGRGDGVGLGNGAGVSFSVTMAIGGGDGGMGPRGAGRLLGLGVLIEERSNVDLIAVAGSGRLNEDFQTGAVGGGRAVVGVKVDLEVRNGT